MINPESDLQQVIPLTINFRYKGSELYNVEAMATTYSSQLLTVQELNETMLATDMGLVTIEMKTPARSSLMDWEDYYAQLPDIEGHSNPMKRIASLSTDAKHLSNQVNKHCELIPDSDITAVIESLGDRFSVDDSRLLMNSLFRTFDLAYKSTLEEIVNEKVLEDALNQVFNGTLTYAQSVNSLMDENKTLVPFVVNGIVQAVMKSQSIEYAGAMEIVRSLGEDKLNSVIFALRVGNNGDLQGRNAIEISNRFKVGPDDDGNITVGLKKSIQTSKAVAVVERNTARKEQFKAMKVMISVLKCRGVDISFKEERFGFHTGTGGLCPVAHDDKTHGEAYLGQVKLALRIINLLDRYIQAKQARIKSEP